MYKVIEKFLSEEDLQFLRQRSLGTIVKNVYTETSDFHRVHLKALEEVTAFVPATGLLGVEEWSFHSSMNTLPNLHQDRDEELFDAVGKLSFPACSCVLYLNVEDLEGGSLVIGEDTIVPKTGMLVLLAPEVWHEVSEHTSGTRHSTNYNFWNVPLYNS
jgi:hypothetical protein|tara:strand:+ start:588 stop:1064 length:477 start_codon:yes stop_codon:yes gene_type:complete